MTRVEVLEVGVYRKLNPCTDHLGRRREQIGTRYVVQVSVCEGMASDGMWSTLTHYARFADKKTAERLAERVQHAVWYPAEHPGTWGGLDLSKWIWYPSVTCPFSDLQKQPTAQPVDVGELPRAK